MAESEQKPNRKRRWSRFSLRTFLIVVTLVCVWITWYVYRVERQKKAVIWVEANAGTVYYDFELDSDFEYLADGQPPVSGWLYNALGSDYFATIKKVEFDVNLQQVMRHYLTDERKWVSPIKDAKPLSSLTSLKVLNLHFTQVYDLKPLGPLTNLEYLNLSETQVADLHPLQNLKNLKFLGLSNTQVMDLTPLASLTNLHQLDLEYTQVINLAPLVGLTNLAYLHLSGTSVNDVSPLSSLSNLTHLDLSGTSVNDVSPLSTLSSLTHLDLSGIPVNDVMPLMTLANLTSLILIGTSVSKAEVEKLQKALPKCKIRLNYNSIPN